jgi:hypothetical protein
MGPCGTPYIFLARLPIYSQPRIRTSDRLVDHYSNENSGSNDENLKKLLNAPHQLPSRHGVETVKCDAANDQMDDGVDGVNERN